jgi:hypothetical protein
VPYTGTRVIHKPDTDLQQTCFQLKISAEPGYEFTVSEAWVNGIANAEIDGLNVGDVIRPDGEHIIVRLRAGPTNGQRLYPAWRISVNEGNVVDLVCRLSTG